MAQGGIDEEIEIGGYTGGSRDSKAYRANPCVAGRRAANTEKLGEIIAAIGAELIAVKEGLDRLSDKTAWLRWLKDHVHYSADTAERYMGVARFAKKIRNVAEFFELDPSALYRIAASC